MRKPRRRKRQEADVGCVVVEDQGTNIILGEPRPIGPPGLLPGGPGCGV